MCEKLWKWKIFMHFLTLFYVSVLNRYRPIMQLSYRYRHRYRPIWKSDISVVIGIGRYEKMLIGRPLVPLAVRNMVAFLNYVLKYNTAEIATSAILFIHCNVLCPGKLIIMWRISWCFLLLLFKYLQSMKMNYYLCNCTYV